MRNSTGSVPFHVGRVVYAHQSVLLLHYTFSSWRSVPTARHYQLASVVVNARLLAPATARGAGAVADHVGSVAELPSSASCPSVRPRTRRLAPEGWDDWTRPVSLPQVLMARAMGMGMGCRCPGTRDTHGTQQADTRERQRRLHQCTCIYICTGTCICICMRSQQSRVLLLPPALLCNLICRILY